MVNDKLPSEQAKEQDFRDNLLNKVNEIRKVEKDKGILLKDMVETKKELDKKEGYSFRFNKRLMDNVKSYAELKGVTTTDIITTFIENQLNTVVAIREELNEPVAVYKDNGKRDVFIGYVKWNNFLDRWNGLTYCYDNDFTIHKGISQIISKDKKEYVLIEDRQDSLVRITGENDLLYIKDDSHEDIRKGTPTNYIGVVIPEKEAIKEILKAGYVDFLVMFPELKDKLKKLTAFEENYNKKSFTYGLNNLSIFMNIYDLIEENNKLNYLLEDLKKKQLTPKKEKEIIKNVTNEVLKKLAN
jgi:hypothetical protein